MTLFKDSHHIILAINAGIHLHWLALKCLYER